MSCVRRMVLVVIAIDTSCLFHTHIYLYTRQGLFWEIKAHGNRLGKSFDKQRTVSHSNAFWLDTNINVKRHRVMSEHYGGANIIFFAVTLTHFSFLGSVWLIFESLLIPAATSKSDGGRLHRKCLRHPLTSDIYILRFVYVWNAANQKALLYWVSDRDVAMGLYVLEAIRFGISRNTGRNEEFKLELKDTTQHDALEIISLIIRM